MDQLLNDLLVEQDFHVPVLQQIEQATTSFIPYSVKL
jgi:hypothetical protein